MSLILAIKSADGGIVLAADSRTVSMDRAFEKAETYQYATDDAGMKLYALPAPHRWVGVMTCGRWVPEDIFEHLPLPPHRLTTLEYAHAVRTSCVNLQRPLCILAAGVDEDGASRLFVLQGPTLEPTELHPGTVGMAYAGARYRLDYFLRGYSASLVNLDPAIADALDRNTLIRNALYFKIPLHEFATFACAGLAHFLVQFVIGAQQFGYKQEQAVSAPIDLAVVTGDGFRWVQRKPQRNPNEPPTLAWHTREKWTPLQVTVDTPTDIERVATYTVSADRKDSCADRRPDVARRVVVEAPPLEVKRTS